jgi:hypothetical protein
MPDVWPILETDEEQEEYPVFSLFWLMKVRGEIGTVAEFVDSIDIPPTKTKALRIVPRIDRGNARRPKRRRPAKRRHETRTDRR